jgi:hypothetical protein
MLKPTRFFRRHVGFSHQWRRSRTTALLAEGTGAPAKPATIPKGAPDSLQVPHHRLDDLFARLCY